MSSAPQPGYPSPGQQATNPYKPGMSPEPPSAAPNKGGCGIGSCLLIGCLGIVLVSILVPCIGGIWFYYNGGKMIAGTARNMIVQVIEQSELEADDKKEVITQVDRVVDAYKQGKITMEDLGKVMEELAKSPLLPLAMIYGVDEKYIKPSGLTDEEKQEARLTLQRVARGAFEKKINEQELEPLLDEVSYKTGSNNQRQFKDTLTDAELKQFLGKAKQLADDKGLPEEEFKVKIGSEFKKAVDEALKGKGL